MNTKPFFLLCLLCALFVISAVASRPATDDLPSKDGTQASVVVEESKPNPELDRWGRGHHGRGHYGGGGHYGGSWGRGGYGGGGGHRGGGGGGGGHGTEANVAAEESKPNPKLDRGGGYGRGGHHGGGCKCCGKRWCKCC